LGKPSHQPVEVRRSEFTARALRLEGKPFSFKGYELFIPIYDCCADEIHMMTGRQVAKSTTCSNFSLAETAIVPFFKILYTSPTREQTRKFSTTRVGKTMAHSPEYRNLYVHPELSQNVLQKIMRNGSELHFTYAADDPDRARGISADRLLADETQDVHYDAVIPVLRECLSASKYAYIITAGTPKTMENSMEFLWKRSTQHEWGLRCPGCSKINFIMDEKSIGLKGPICKYCGHLLDVVPNYHERFDKRNGFWVPANPEKARMGFHIPQPVLALHANEPKKWKTLLSKMPEGDAGYSLSRFKNEVLGVSDALGKRMITRDQLIALCDSNHTFATPPQKGWNLAISNTAAGIDWGGGSVTKKGTLSDMDAVSRTVLWIWGLWKNRAYKCFFYKIFPSDHPVHDIEEIIKYLRMFGVEMVYGDAGEGHVANNMIQEALGPGRLYQCQYGFHKKPITWNAHDRYLLDRTSVIDCFFLQRVLKKRVLFASKQQMSAAFDDFLTEYEEVTSDGTSRRVWRHAPSEPDDALHAAIFGWLAMMSLTSDYNDVAAFDTSMITQ